MLDSLLQAFAHLEIVAHSDWSAQPEKRWMAQAIRGRDGRFRALAPRRVEQAGELLGSLRALAGPLRAVLAGFDFPIGLPGTYASRAGIDDFLAFLEALGQGEWPDFCRVAGRPEEISLQRPFYPDRTGGASRAHLVRGLGLQSFDDLLRQCERPYPGRRAACPLFWTLGGQQVGKAALAGWREVLIPALSAQGGHVVGQDGILPLPYQIWPFHGQLETLLQPGRLVVAETYPAEFYRHLGVSFSPNRRGARSGKRSTADRSTNAPRLLGWAESAGIVVEAALEEKIQAGFGPDRSGEDQFDAVVGLFGMLDLVLRRRPAAEPESGRIRKVEGWILGQEPEDVR